jgi:hypothetical protein
MEHSPTSATGTAWERTRERATQRAAWEALTRANRTSGGGRVKANRTPTKPRSLADGALTTGAELE